MADKRFYYAILAGSDDSYRVRALTSKIYPIYQVELVNLDLGLYDISVLDIGKLTNQEEKVTTNIGIFDIVLKSLILETNYQIEEVSTNFGLFDVKIIDLLINTEHQYEEVNTNIGLYNVSILELAAPTNQIEECNINLGIYEVSIYAP